MSLFIASINSGSNGNCYYVGNAMDAVLVDVGITCKEVEERLKKLNLSIKNIKAIFITHEHADHIRGVSVLANKYSLPVYITNKTARHGIRLIKHLSKEFEAHQPITIGTLTVVGFDKKHDALDPHSFIVSGSGVTVGVFTDIGVVCDNLIHYFKQCHAVFLESNYDEAMLETGKYPAILKKRIRGGNGHLSNKQAVELFKNHKPDFMTHVILSHLSKENNTPEIAEKTFNKYADGVEVIVASRFEASDIYQINPDSIITTNTSKKISLLKRVMQLGLFD
jgi:phosphoribosyl 1,2-cyclic phosphodiesterase